MADEHLQKKRWLTLEALTLAIIQRDRGKHAKNSSKLWGNFRAPSIRLIGVCEGEGQRRDGKRLETFLNLKKTANLDPRSPLTPQHERQEQNCTKARQQDIAHHW